MMGFKKWLVLGIEATVQTENYKGNKITIVTAAGIITGDVVNIIVNENDKTPVDLNEHLDIAARVIYDKYLEENNLEKPLQDNDGYMSLKNVTIISSGKTTLASLLVFFDQIIGVSFGNID